MLTDSPIMEALNDRMKAELYLDYDLSNTEDVSALLNQNIQYFHTCRRASHRDTKAQFSTKPNRASDSF